MTQRKSFIELLQLKYPLVVAPMAGGPSSVELVSRASDTGALGSVGAAYLAPSAIDEFLSAVKQQTKKYFAVNLFVPAEPVRVASAAVELAIQSTAEFRSKLSLPSPPLAAPFEEDFDKQIEVILRHRPKVLSFVFGVLGERYMKELTRAGILTVGTATTLDEARLLVESGVDAVVAQGVEAGGHRGIFDVAAEDPNIQTIELVKSLKEKISVPIIAAGGIMNAKDIRSALHAGAAAVQMGTAFLTTAEAGTSMPYREELLRANIRETRLTRSFSGRLARGVVNEFMTKMDVRPDAILPFPIQNKFTRDLRAASVKANSSECLSLWAGTGEGPLWRGSAKDLIVDLFATEK